MVSYVNKYKQPILAFQATRPQSTDMTQTTGTLLPVNMSDSDQQLTFSWFEIESEGKIPVAEVLQQLAWREFKHGRNGFSIANMYE